MTDRLPPTANPEHLTALLRQSGVLGAARVGNVTMTSSFPKLRSLTRRLRLDYEGPAPDAPAWLILKMGHLDSAGRPLYANRNEFCSTATSPRPCRCRWCRAAMKR